MAQRKDAEETSRASKAYRDSTKVEPPKADPGLANLRSGGVSNVKPDEALRGDAENKRLQANPPPLVHMDPSTGQPISKPFDESGKADAEPNQLTTPGAAKDAPKDGRPMSSEDRARADRDQR